MKKKFISFFLTLSCLCLPFLGLAGPKNSTLLRVRGDKLVLNSLLGMKRLGKIVMQEK